MDPKALGDRRLQGGRPCKQVILSESEILQRYVVSGDIFRQQPNLFKLEAPIKICGLSPDLKNLDQIRNLARPTDVPDTVLLCDILKMSMDAE